MERTGFLSFSFLSLFFFFMRIDATWCAEEEACEEEGAGISTRGDS